ncbi:MAG: TRAP transporter substrate-binding protein [Lachnospiraceae bacterium]
MRKKKFFILILGCLLLVTIGWFLRDSGKTKVPELVLTYAENQSDDYPTTQGAVYFAELVSKKTEGRIQIIVLSNSELGTEPSVIEQMQFGGIDFSRVSISSFSDKQPKLNVLQMPYLYNSAEHMWKVLDSEIGDDFLKIFEKSDLIGLSWYDAGARNFYNDSKPIETLEDMQGLRIRVQNSFLMERVVESLGAVAVPTDYEDVYESFETGTIDGAENNWPSYESQHHYEFARYYTIDEHTRVPEVQICSKATWDKLSEGDQKIILECAKLSAVYERELWISREIESRNIVEAKGIEVNELSQEEKEKFRVAVAGIYTEFCSEYTELIAEIQEKDNDE